MRTISKGCVIIAILSHYYYKNDDYQATLQLLFLTIKIMIKCYIKSDCQGHSMLFLIWSLRARFVLDELKRATFFEGFVEVVFFF